MKKNFALSSDSLGLIQHDCRLNGLKFHTRNTRYDLSVLSRIFTQTNESLSSLYDTYLHQKEDAEDLEKKLNEEEEKASTTDRDGATTTLILETSSKNSKKISKLIKEINLNSSKSYGQFYWPNSICCNQRDEIICCDTLNHRLLVFTSEFIYKYQIGNGNCTSGHLNGHFNEPCDVQLNECEKLFVADRNNHRIQIFSEIRRFRQIETPNKLTARSASKKKLTTDASLANMNANATGSKSKQQQFDLSNNKIITSTGFEYVFDESVQLKEKPVKICCAIFSNINAVSTESGSIYILNNANQIVSYLNLNKNFNPNDLRNICLNEDGSELICLKTKEENLMLKYYKIEDTDQNDYDEVEAVLNEKLNKKKLSYTSSIATIATTPIVVRKLKLIRKCEVERVYQPGICLAQPKFFRFNIDLSCFIVYDQLNLNLLEYSLNGKFNRILLKGENGIDSILSFDYSSDKEHLITTEFLFNKKMSLLNETMPVKIKKDLSTSNDGLYLIKKRSMPYTFKLKAYVYKDCECHRRSAKSKSISRLTNLNRNAGLSQSFTLITNSFTNFT